MTSAMILSQSPLDLVAIAAYEQEEQMAYEQEEEVAVSSMGLNSDQGEKTTTNGIDSQRLAVGEESVPSLQDEDHDESAAADIDATMDEILAEDDDDDCADTGSRHKTFGGLSNLGNTCYMASALQMLASLDSFVESVRDEDLPEEKDQTLRSAFLDLMQRLNNGETVHPHEFKAVIDERSPLFVGYRQQDSHEFITNLLDFLDEDYTIKKENENHSATAEDEANESNEMDVSLSSCRKKAKTKDENVADDGHEMATSDEYEVPHSPLTSPSSFSQLDMNDIDHLLHGSSSCRKVNVASPVATPPRYKLVGGRMNTTGAVLTSYESAKVNVQDDTSLAVPLENSKSPSSSAPCIETEAPRKTPIDSYFTTTCRVRLTCDSCKFTRCHKETFLHLSLEIAPDCGSVEDGLRRFFAPEKRELKCEKCFAESATQTMEITELPKALLLHFKRFIVDISPDYSAISYRKNQSIVAFDDHLEIQEDSGGILTEFLAHDCLPPKCSSPSPSYALRSIVNHIGSSASCGHYTADANRRYSSGARHWTRFNDSYVTTISQFEAIDSSQRTAYMVMYELV